MPKSPAYKLFCFVTTLVFISNPLHAVSTDHEDIYSTSIKWEDEAGKIALLQSTPKWSDKDIQTLFKVYLELNKTKFSALPTNSISVHFINMFWGPVNNPFNRLVRPSKAFIFVSNPKNAYDYYIAPLMQNTADTNFYVYDVNFSRPRLLNDWVNDIHLKYPASQLRFNICNAYATLPSTSCQEESYQSEISNTSNISLSKLSDLDVASSAHRELQEDWRQKAAQMQKTHALKTGDSIYGSSINWNDSTAKKALLQQIVVWPNYKVIQDNFKNLRDIRLYTDEQHPNFLRRVTWLYPDDGCWTRAAAVINNLFGPFHNLVKTAERPSKVFVFGSLCALTPNSPDNKVSWWYHTAPIVKDAETQQDYVLDPAVNPHNPLPLQDWVDAITSNQGACKSSYKASADKFNICNGYGSGPYSPCQDEVGFYTEARTSLMQDRYRALEYKRQISLERNPEEVLGDSPPWLKR